MPAKPGNKGREHKACSIDSYKHCTYNTRSQWPQLCTFNKPPLVTFLQRAAMQLESHVLHSSGDPPPTQKWHFSLHVRLHAVRYAHGDIFHLANAISMAVTYLHHVQSEWIKGWQFSYNVAHLQMSYKYKPSITCLWSSLTALDYPIYLCRTLHIPLSSWDQRGLR